MSLAKERADFVEALKEIIASDWETSEDDGDSYYCRFCRKIEKETTNGFLVNHYPHCVAYIAKKVLDKNGVK